MSRYKLWQRFHTFKLRGECVELLFMAEAALHGFLISKPWGDCSAYDVGVEHGPDFLRVQVKSSTARKGGGFLCRLRHGRSGEDRYDPDQVDVFAVYIIPADAWYLIPSAAVFLPTSKVNLRFYPDGPPRPGRHDHEHDYERYREAWRILAKTREELCQTTRRKIRERTRL